MALCLLFMTAFRIPYPAPSIFTFATTPSCEVETIDQIMHFVPYLTVPIPNIDCSAAIGAYANDLCYHFSEFVEILWKTSLVCILLLLFDVPFVLKYSHRLSIPRRIPSLPNGLRSTILLGDFSAVSDLTYLPGDRVISDQQCC